MKPEGLLINVSKKYPDINTYINLARNDKHELGDDWPEWCFMPMYLWGRGIGAIALRGLNKKHSLAELNLGVAELVALGTWQFSKGIYKIDPDLMTALSESAISGNIPSEILYKLPEWCIYVETPGYSYMGIQIEGFWAHLEYDINHDRPELRLLLNTDFVRIPVPLHLGEWSLLDSIQKASAVAEMVAESMGVSIIGLEEVTKLSVAALSPLISILLYICSEKPEIDDNRLPGVSPSLAQPAKTKKGWKLIPRGSARTWNVGNQIGSILRAADENAEPSVSTGRRNRAHVRRGHWHTFWTGKKTEKQKPILNWIPPLIAGGY